MKDLEAERARKGAMKDLGKPRPKTIYYNNFALLLLASTEQELHCESYIAYRAACKNDSRRHRYNHRRPRHNFMKQFETIVHHRYLKHISSCC